MQKSINVNAGTRAVRGDGMDELNGIAAICMLTHAHDDSRFMQDYIHDLMSEFGIKCSICSEVAEAA